jgi:TusA-related sulfurtransferase
MIFDIAGSKKTREQIEQEKELRAWTDYGQEVEDFLKDAHLEGEFERLEKSKYATRPKVTVQVIDDKDTPLSDDIKLRVKRGEIQASKAYRFMTDPELRAMFP